MRAHEFIFEKSLTPVELSKRNNLQTFINKIAKGEEFETVDGSAAKIKPDPDLLNDLSKRQFPARLPVEPEGFITFGKIKKTKEFGGEPAGNRERIEQVQIQEISDQLERAKAGSTFINLIVGDRTVNAASVEKTPGQAKSDMTILDETGKSVAWVSLKGHRFRWGGWTHLKDNPEISAWIKRIISETGNTLDPGQSYGLHISENLANRIIYGKNFGSTERGVSNVDCVLVGDPKINSSAEGFILTSSTVYKNGDSPKDSHAPYLVIRYMQGRTDAGFVNARAETNTVDEKRKIKWLDTSTSQQSAPGSNLSPDILSKANPKTITTLKGSGFTTPSTKSQFNRNVALEVSKSPLGKK
jgi:hypothetical protein